MPPRVLQRESEPWMAGGLSQRANKEAESQRGSWEGTGGQRCALSEGCHARHRSLATADLMILAKTSAG